MQSRDELHQRFKLGAGDFKKMILGASLFFDREKEKINALNVFPVPDGDTGTNMSMTLKAALEGSSNYEGHSIGELSDIVASRALMGARGNSGVILSQILRGIARGLRQKEYISPGELSKAFQYGVVYAYKAVSKPVEGTILTVAREMARAIRATAHKGESLHDTLQAAVNSGKATLARTTEMLPALKEAGVVDAGGMGLLVFIEGWVYALKKSFNDILSLRYNDNEEDNQDPFYPLTVPVEAEPLDLRFPYCTEMIIRNEENKFDKLRNALEPHGDSLLVAAEKDFAKVHIHTANPGLILQIGLEFGSLHDLKIENMIDQHEAARNRKPSDTNIDLIPSSVPHLKGDTGLIAVSFGEGFREILLSLGVDEIVFGGQTMNPNVSDLLKAVENLEQKKIIILPNNKNIIMVAEQVKTLSKKEVEVLNTKTLPEGIAAIISFKPDAGMKKNLAQMGEAIGQVKTGLITYATRDLTLRDLPIEKGQYLGLDGSDILSAGNILQDTALELVKRMEPEEAELLTIYYGEDVSSEEGEELASAIGKKFPTLDIELHYGGQPIYYYIFSFE